MAARGVLARRRFRSGVFREESAVVGKAEACGAARDAWQNIGRCLAEVTAVTIERSKKANSCPKTRG